MSKKRIDLYVTQQQNGWLEEESDERGISKSEIMRRALDFYREMKSD